MAMASDEGAKKLMGLFVNDMRHTRVLASTVSLQEAGEFALNLLDIGTATGGGVIISRAVIQGDIDLCPPDTDIAASFLTEKSLSHRYTAGFARRIGCQYLRAALAGPVETAVNASASFPDGPDIVAAGNALVAALTDASSVSLLVPELRAIAGHIVEAAGARNDECLPVLSRWFVTCVVEPALVSPWEYGVLPMRTDGLDNPEHANANLASLALLMRTLITDSGFGNAVPATLPPSYSAFGEEHREGIKYFLMALTIDDGTGGFVEGKAGSWSKFDKPLVPESDWPSLTDGTVLGVRRVLLKYMGQLEHHSVADVSDAAAAAAHEGNVMLSEDGELLVKNLDNDEYCSAKKVEKGTDPGLLYVTNWLTYAPSVLEMLNSGVQRRAVQLVRSISSSNPEATVLQRGTCVQLKPQDLLTGCVMLLHEPHRQPTRCHVCVDGGWGRLFLRTPLDPNAAEFIASSNDPEGCVEALDAGGEIATMLGSTSGSVHKMRVRSWPLKHLLGILVNHEAPVFDTARCHEDVLFRHMRMGMVWLRQTVCLEADSRQTRDNWYHVLTGLKNRES